MPSCSASPWCDIEMKNETLESNAETDLPPIMVYYGAHEMLAGEAVEFAKRAKDAGVDVSLRSLPEGQHNFIWGAGRVPETTAIEEIGGWLRSKLALAALVAA